MELTTIRISRIVGVQADNRAVLLEFLGRYVPVDPLSCFSLLSIQMPCGQRMEYEKEADIPVDSVHCPCGDPTHWIIRYEPVGKAKENNGDKRATESQD